MTHATTAPIAAIGTATADNRSTGTGITRAFNAVYKALISAQQARANVRVRPYLARQTDATLERLGFSRSEIDTIKSAATARDLPWR